MMFDRVTFYEAVTATVKLDPQTYEDEHLVGDSWCSLEGRSLPVTLCQSIPTPLAIDNIMAQVRDLPEDLYLFVFFFLDREGVRVGFFRTSSPEVLKWGDRECPPWFRAPIEGPSRYDRLMEGE